LVINAMLPFESRAIRTRFMLGPYPARQASANFAPSIPSPFFRSRFSTSRVTEVRQSTTVPNTSKMIALACN
jgi:hypothetical protein